MDRELSLMQAAKLLNRHPKWLNRYVVVEGTGKNADKPAHMLLPARMLSGRLLIYESEVLAWKARNPDELSRKRGRKPSVLSAEERRQMLLMRAAGASVESLVERFGVSKAYIYSAIGKMIERSRK